MLIRAGRHELNVAVRTSNDARRSTLLLCNGIGAKLELLEPFVEMLDPAIEVVRFDVPGVGASPTPMLPYTINGLAIDVARMMTAAGYTRFDVLGISWGGALAQQLAFYNPRRVRRLVLAATATGALMVPAHPRVLLKMVTPRRYRDVGYARSVAGELYGGALAASPAEVASIMRVNEGHPTTRGYLLQLLAGLGWTSLPFLPLIRQRTLILSGLDDRIVLPINGRIMNALLPHATLLEYDDGHLGLVTMADQLAPEVARFVHAP